MQGGHHRRGTHHPPPRAFKMLDRLAAGLRAAPSTCSASSSASWMPRRNFAHWRNPWADTGTSTGILMLAVLGGLADVERELIRTRTAEGRSRAKKARAAHGP